MLFGHSLFENADRCKRAYRIRKLRLDSYRRDRTEVAVMVQVDTMNAYIKLAVRYQFGPLTIANQPDVLDHPANPSAIAPTQPPPTNGVIVDYYLLAHRPSASIYQIDNPTQLQSSHKLSCLHLAAL
jgi:hypothetical protein